jgi:nucleotide-binding universal stress UspA family protein
VNATAEAYRLSNARYEKGSDIYLNVLDGVPEEYREMADREDSRVQLQTWQSEREAHIRAYLAQMSKTLVGAGFSDSQVEIKLQPVARGIARDIIKEAETGDYSVVMMSRRGMANALQSIILGSVAVKLLQALSFVPLVFVGRAAPVKKTLLAVDASESSQKAVDFVASFLDKQDLQAYELCIFHAILGLGAVDFEVPEGAPVECSRRKLPDTGLERFKIKTGQMMLQVRERLLAAGFSPDKITEKIVSGAVSRSEAIVCEAEAGGYSTIVVGRRGLSRLEGFFMGRVGHKVVYGGKNFTVWVV